MLTAEALAALLVSAATGLKDERAILKDALLDVLPTGSDPAWAKRIADRVAPFSVYMVYTYEDGDFSWWPPMVGPPDTPYVALRHALVDLDDDLRADADSPMVSQTRTVRIMEYGPDVVYQSGSRPWRRDNKASKFYLFDVTIYEDYTSWWRANR